MANQHREAGNQWSSLFLISALPVKTTLCKIGSKILSINRYSMKEPTAFNFKSISLVISNKQKALNVADDSMLDCQLRDQRLKSQPRQKKKILLSRPQKNFFKCISNTVLQLLVFLLLKYC